MGYQPFYIASFEDNSGEFTYLEPFLIPDKAFQTLEDAFCWRGRILKRPGVSLRGRLRRQLNSVTLTNQAIGAAYLVADILNDAAIDVRAPAAGIAETYAEIQPGSVSITVGGVTFSDTGKDGILVGAPATNSGTINYVTGELNLAFNPALGVATDVIVTLFYYPSLPCMGLQRRESAAENNEQSIAFDTKYSYTISGTQFIELPSTAATTWTGTDADLFWATNYYIRNNQRLYWATNFNQSYTDPIRYYDGVTWTDFIPDTNSAGTTQMIQARVLIPFKNRLIALNVVERTGVLATTHVNKIRWSWNGDPTNATAWHDDIPGRGGYLVAPTNEAIISAAFIRDTVLVKFERSSWKLVYTGNENLPFVFQKIDTDLGCESTFSPVTFDKGVLSVGDKAITIDDSVNVTRIDRTVPNTVFNIRNDQRGTERVYGIRDYASELVYWAYPDSTTSGVAPKFPNKVIVYNYANNTFAKFNDSFTCYGYYQKTQNLTWADYSSSKDIWKTFNQAWNSGVAQSLFPDVVAGNQQGFVSILSPATAPRSANSETLAIFAITSPAGILNQLTVPNHNLQTGQYIKISGIIGTDGGGAYNPNILNNDPSGTNLIFQVRRIDSDNISLYSWDASTSSFSPFDLGEAAYTGIYWGGGVVSALNNFNITTKQFSPFYEVGSQCRLGYIDLFLDITSSGQISADVFVDCDMSSSITSQTADANGPLLGKNIVYTSPENTALYPSHAIQNKIWHRIFTQCIAQNFTLRLSLSDQQMADSDIDASSYDFGMHAMAFYLSKNSRLVS